jgi:glycosyltransferase involved in cell wall biosynthesis
MRIAIYHNLPSGGGKRALFEMTKRLANKHELDVYTLSCAEHNFCDLRPYVKQHIVFAFTPLLLFHRPFGRLNQLIRIIDLLRLRALQQRIARQIDAKKYDLVFVHNCRYSQAPTVLQFLKTSSVYYCQELPRIIYEPSVPRPYASFSVMQRILNYFDPLPAFYHSFLAKFDCTSVLKASLVLTNSTYSAESLQRIYGIFAKICYLGVETDFFRPMSLPKENFVLSVGALAPHKGFDFLIRSLALMDASIRPALVIVSNYADNQEYAYLQELANQLGVRVSFRILVSNEELVRLYNQAKLTLYSPIKEPFGFVPLESMACGTAVVGVREGGVRETVIDGVSGILVDRDPMAMAEAVSDLLNNPKKTSEMEINGRAVAKRQWSWEETIIKLERYLNEIIPK